MTATHIVFSAIPAWGHARPFCVLAARLVKENKNLIITIVLAPTLLSKAHREVDSELRGDTDESILRRIRILSSFQSDSANPFELMPLIGQTYPLTYESLVKGQPVSCHVTNTAFDAAPPPTLVILDFFAFPQMTATRAITGKSVPILAWVTGFASSFIRQLGPERLGGIGNLGQQIDEEVARTGGSPEEIGEKIYKKVDGSVVKIAGIPEMYDYEFFPQRRAFPVSVSMILRGAWALLDQSDGVILATPYVLESESIDAVKDWFTEWDNKEVFVVGPLIPESIGKLEQSHHGADEIKAFLDNMLEKQGEHSVVYISFGTIFWPAEVKYLEELINVLLEKKMPFIMSHASPFAKIPDDLAEKVKSSGIGLFTPWSPQQYIITHPATGWFLTHCGHNGVLEALGNGIPLIAWPFEADQPIAALHLSDVLIVAIELVEVRTSDDGLKPLRRSGRAPKGTIEAVRAEIKEVVDTCRGPKGDIIRKNAKILKKQFSDAWGAEGASRQDIRALLSKYAPQVLL